MKTKYLLLGAIFAVFGLTGRAQVTEMYTQGFESGETVNYSGAPSSGVRYSTTIRSVGGRSMKLVQNTTQDVELVLDTIDFTQNTTLRYIALRFDHICRVPMNSSDDFAMGMIYYKRANQTTWTALSRQEYNQSGGNGTFSNDFASSDSFKDQSYSDWWSTNVPTVSNSQWRSERFDLDNVMTSGVPASERKLLIKFVLHFRTLSGTLDTVNAAWWLDNIRVSASSERMVTPKITMVEYPTVEMYPNSRGAHIELQATTTVSAGINADSVYVVYKGGSDETQHRLYMTPVQGVANSYECRIPFYGYDTLMRFYCVVHDATVNSSRARYPVSEEEWVEYRCVRGTTEQPGLVTPGFTPTGSTGEYPFPWDADHRSEMVYDSALMRGAGYGPGAITAMRFTLASGVTQERTERRFQVKMKNVPANYALEMDENYYMYNFTREGMQTVYDSALRIPVMPSNLDYTITFQDTFFYTGNDIIMQITYDGLSDHSSPVYVKTISAPTGKQTIFSYGGEASYGYEPFTWPRDFTRTLHLEAKRPAFIFVETSLQPLLYDAGISELVDPNYDVPMTERPDSIRVKLKNYGERELNAVRISYNIDGTVTGHYDWSSSLAGGAETEVLIATGVNLPAGFHMLTVWVEDTVTSNGGRYRDHEPYNDTSRSAFVVCDGAMSGVRNIGGANADFNTIEEFLFSLSRCGVDDSLTVRLAAGQYPPFRMEAVPGLSEQNYIVFESRTPATRAVLYSDSTTGAASIVNLEEVNNVRFRNIDFKRINGPLTDMVTLGPGSENCRFEGCLFEDMLTNPVASLRVNALVNSGNADDLTVDTCVFRGGNIGVNVRGAAPDDYSEGVVVRRSLFEGQYSNAVKVEYESDVRVEDNEMMDVLSNSSYVLLLNGCSGEIGLERNRIYTSRGAGALALSDVAGSGSTGRALVANNMLVCADDGTANQLTTPLNVIQGEWIDVVYNSVQLNAPTRMNVAAASFGGGVLNNSRFMNNIVACVDNMNFALNYLPGSSTTNEVKNNDYYSNGTVMNRRGGAAFVGIEGWRTAVPEDSLSVSVNPNFLNTTIVDLRTYNRNLKGVGRPLATVGIDMFGNVRGDSVTCPGAFEFSSLPYDFEPEALVSPELETCNMPGSVELAVRLRNSGIGVYDSTNTNRLSLSYRVNNGAVQTMTVDETIPADDTVTVWTGRMLSLPSNTYSDAVYTLRLWVSSADDPNQTNDTNVITVVSHYHPVAPANILDSIAYSASDTITPTAGVDTWQVYGLGSAPRRQSTLYWYSDSLATDLIHEGPTFVTGPLQGDTTYYVRQRRALPIVRMTQVEILQAATAAGLTTPMPYWMLSNRKAAVQLTNIGDATAYLEGDTLMTVSPTAGLNAKVYRFGNVKIEPGASLVVQFAPNNTVTDTSVTIVNNVLGNTNVAYNSNVAFVYKRGGVVEDALPLNGVITSTSTQAVTWANVGVPTYVWSGSALTFPNNTAGLIRTSFNGGVGDWELSTATEPMFLASTNEGWVMYEDNGCDGDLATVRVGIIAPPPVDVDVAGLTLPESSCGLGSEDVTVTVSNFGGDTIGNLVLNYCAGGDTVTDTVPGVVLPHSAITYTFGTPLNLAFANDSTVTVRVWADSIAGDPIRENDTTEGSVTSLFTPEMPPTIADRVVPYATRDTITHTPTLRVMPVWYDYNLNPVDTGYTHVTEILYGNGTKGMSYLSLSDVTYEVGRGTLTNGNTAWPSPYQSTSKFAKQQYLYTASDLRAEGMEACSLRGISFYLDSIVGTRDSINLLNYTIKLGTTSDTVFTLTTAAGWKEATTTVYSRDTLTLYQDGDKAWVEHLFATPFEWDGASTIVVEVSYNLTAAVSTGVRTRYTPKDNTTLHKNKNSAITATDGSLAKDNKRPNIKFTAEVLGCPGPMTTFDVTLSGMPQRDAALSWDMSWGVGTGTPGLNSCDTVSLPVKVRNQGSDPFDTLALYYYLDNLALDSVVVIDSFAAGHTYNFTLLNRTLSPGRHTVTAFVRVSGDAITSNDTIRTTFMVRLCGGTYTIALNDATADFPSFNAAIDTLNQVGITGPVTFQVSPGTYTEQVVLHDVFGSSDVNTVNFIGQGENVMLTASTSQAANYVMMLDGASNVKIENLSIVARPTANNVNYANALVLTNGSNIRVDSCYVKVKGTITNANASCIVLQGNVTNLTIAGTVTDSGYYAIKTVGSVNNYSNFHIHDNIFRDFASGGVYLRDISRVILSRNEIRSSNSANNRGLIGVYMAETTDSMVIQKNAIYLVDERQGAKRGIQLENVTGTLTAPAVVVNNMISTHGTGSAGLSPAKSAGIWIDTMSSYVSVLYNSVRVKGSNVTASSTASQLNNANNLTYAFWCGASPTQITVMNNIFSNFGYGYAYYLSQVNTVTTSNYNAYFTQAANMFAVGTTTNIGTLSDWQTVYSTDGNSVVEEPYFVANDNLHLRMTNFAAKAQYNTEVVDDIDGNIRPQIPGPTIGAHEAFRENHDMAVVYISKPELPVSLSNPNNVETDSVLVVAAFNNNGLSNETNVMWYAYIEGYETTARSVSRNLGTFVPAQMKVDSVMVPSYLGIIDTQRIHVVVMVNNDQNLENNEMSKPFYLAPAFNLAAMEVTATSPYTPAGCRMQQNEIRIRVKNSGSKDFPAGTAFTIGYHTEVTNPTTVTIPTLPDVVEQTVVLDNILPQQSDVWFTFDSLANLYPTGTYTNIKVRVRGWVSYQYDITKANDSINLSNINSYPTPAAPVGHDTTFAYGTWGEVTAEQENNRPIRWYRDSTAAPYYSPSQYNASKKWSNTPQYFHDSTYYLNALSDKQCPSYYSQVHVSVMPRKTRDMAVEHMLAPLGGRVYMENDTVRVQIANYGTAAQTDFPITYQLKRGNNIIQTVTETVTETIAADQTYVYTFDTLLNIPTPTTAQTYFLSVWTDLTNDATRRNDTLRTAHTFASLSQDVYNTFHGNIPSSDDTRFDITRVSFNSIDFEIPPLNRSYTNLAEDYSNPDYPVLHVTRGTTDSIVIQVTPFDAAEQHFRCRGNVNIDFNRDGSFVTNNSEYVVNNVVFYSDSLLSGLVTIPSTASLGYMRMRVKVMGYETESTEGHIIDFLLFVDDEAPETDLAITQIVTPRDHIIRNGDPKVVKFRMANRGRTPISNVDIHYSFIGDTIDSTAAGVIPWTGMLDAGTSTVVELPAHVFPLRTSTLVIWHDMAGDVDSTNNRLEYEYHRSVVLRPILTDDFEGIDNWYAPRGNTAYSRNYWQRGMPNKSSIDTTYSGANAWVTDLNSSIVTGKLGNVSLLYSPIINISSVRADTISLRLRRNLINGSSMYIEYYNYERKWVRLAHDSTPIYCNWYNENAASFTGTSSPSEPYGEYYFSGVTLRMTNDFNENTQFRIVYTTPMGSINTSSYGAGCAVDDFHVGRAQAKIDAGVVAITKPEAPKYGQTIYPEVVVKNYGWDTLRSIRIGYTHYGTYLAKYTEVSCRIAPGATDTFLCTSPFVVTSDYPDEFHITAFTTRSDDNYRNNDTLMQMFTLQPLDKDISAEELLAPLDYVVAGDTAVKVTLRIRNFGVDPVYTATASYIVNGITRIDEAIDFEEILGRPLQSLEYFNYTFHRRITAPMGLMNITGIIKSPTNNYIYNDTVSKRVEGIMSITDIAASAVIVDTSDFNHTRIALVIDNVGARGVNNFEVGYWIDNDTTNMVRETYYRAQPLPALQTGYYTFSTMLPMRSSGYNIVSAFVHVDGDNDTSNDTTDVFANQFVDIEVMRVLVEENASNDCRVFLELRNVGNIAVIGQQLRMRAVINGSDSNVTNTQRRVDPGEVIHLELNRRIPKSPTRTYVGTGYIRAMNGDHNQANDQTSIVDVINYFEGAPTVNGENLVLEQNYPNPFTQQTTIPFTLPNAANVRFFVMDAMGHIVHSAEQVYQAGSHLITVDMEAYAAGVYYYGIEVNGQRQMRKMILK